MRRRRGTISIARRPWTCTAWATTSSTSRLARVNRSIDRSPLVYLTKRRRVMTRLMAVGMVAMWISGCASYGGWEPTVDTSRDMNRDTLARDLAECKELASKASGGTATEAAKGTGAGAVIGAAAGAVIGAVSGNEIGRAHV